MYAFLNFQSNSFLLQIAVLRIRQSLFGPKDRKIFKKILK